jgi:hypothetical protein
MKIITGKTGPYHYLGSILPRTEGKAPDGSGWGGSFEIYASKLVQAYDVPDPTVFEQDPYDEGTVPISSKLELKPVLHAKITGVLRSRMNDSKPNTPDPSKTDVVFQTRGAMKHLIHMELGGTTQFSYDSSYFSTSSKTTVLMRSEVLVSAMLIPAKLGRSALLFSHATILYPVEGSGRIYYYAYRNVRFSRSGDLLDGGFFNAMSYCKNSAGKTIYVTSSAYPTNANRLVNPDNFQHWLGEYRKYALGFTSEVLDCAASSTGNGNIKPVTCSVDPVDIPSLSPYNYMFGEFWRGIYSLPALASKAYETLPGFDGNGTSLAEELPFFSLACLQEAAELEDLAIGLRSIGKSKFIQSAVSSAAKAFLGVHFGIKLTLLDIQEMLNSKIEVGVKRVSSQESGVAGAFTWTARYHVYYTDGLTQSLAAFLSKYADIDWDAANVWDMVPYSFIVDWFYDLGRAFSAADNYYSLRKVYRVAGTCDSLKMERPLRPGEIPGDGLSDLRFTYYRRHVSEKPVVPLENYSSTPTSTNLVEGAALIVARIAK